MKLLRELPFEVKGLSQERQVSNFTELAPLILIGLIAVLAILGSTSAVRYALFGPGPIPAWR